MSKEDRSSLDGDILSYLRRSCQSSAAAVSRKDIQKQLAVKKKDVKHTLKRLVKQNVIAKNGKKYTYIQPKSSSSSSSIVGSEDIVPIAQRMRTKDDDKHQQLQRGESNNNKVDLDDEIKRLEAELAADNSSNSESDDDIEDDDFESDDDNTSNNKKTISFGEDSIHKYDNGKQTTNSHEADIGGTGVICLSNVANDRIEPLPQSALPQNKRKMLKGIDSVDDNEGSSSSNKRSKKQKLQDKEEHKVSEGLKHAVQDLLQNYIRPSQIDRPPFYCRVCQHQSSSQSEFDTHRASEFHKVAVKEEQKKTYCKLCRKQLTSVVQMEEHLKSKPHRQKMDYVKNKQRGLIGGRDSGGRGGRGRGGLQSSNGRGGRGMQNGSSRRQWC